MRYREGGREERKMEGMHVSVDVDVDVNVGEERRKADGGSAKACMCT